MKAIILAAGQGKRLQKYTKGLPKGMLPFAGQPILGHQIQTLRSSGIEDIVIVRGFESAKINFPGITYYENPDWEHTNMVETLMCAQRELQEDVLVCYADILYESRVLQTVLKTPCDIGVTVDRDFLDYWNARLDDPQSDHESLVIKGNQVVQLGTPNPPPEHIHGRYVGLLKFSKKGGSDLQRVYDEQRAKYADTHTPWLNSKSFKKAYMTDMVQAMINADIKVTPIAIKRGWLEFDTNEDYEKYQEWLRTGEMESFFHLTPSP